MAEVANKVIRGTFGKLWLNGKLLANVKSFEAKITLNYETINVNNELADQQRYIGYSIAGTMVLHKIDSYVIKLLKDAIPTGVLPELKLVGALADPDSNGSERVEIWHVTLDEVTLAQWENAGVSEESVPYKAGGYRMIDTIN